MEMAKSGRVPFGYPANLPRECMGFRDYPFIPWDDPDQDPRLFSGHREVLMYLKDFVDIYLFLGYMNGFCKLLILMEMEISCGTSARNRSDDLKKDGSKETHSRNFELESANNISRSNSHFRSMNALEILRESVKILRYNLSEVKYVEGILGKSEIY